MSIPLTSLRLLCFAFAFLTLPIALFSDGTNEDDLTDFGPTTLSVLLPYQPPFESPVLDGPISDYILQHFASPNQIQVEWVPVAREELTDKLTRMLAAAAAPDLSHASISLLESFHQLDYLAPLDHLTAQYGSNITDTAWGTALPYGKFGTDTLWAIPRAQNLPALTSGWVMRQDWLDDHGLPVPDTTDSFLETALEIRRYDPPGAGSNLAVIGINYNDLGFQIRDIITSFLDPSMIRSPLERTAYGWGLFPGNVLLSAPGFLDGLRFLNRLNAEGLFPPDWPEDSFAMYNHYVYPETMFTTAAPYIAFLSRLHSRTEQLSRARWIPVNPFSARDGANYKYAPALATDALFVPYHTPQESAASAIKYLDWHADPSVHLWMRYGDSRAPGAPSPEPQWRLLGNIMSCGPLCAPVYRADAHHMFPSHHTEIDRFLDLSSSDVIRSILNPPPTDADRAFSLHDLRVRQKEWIAQIILADRDDVDRLYDLAVDDLEQRGMADLITRNRVAFRGRFTGELPLPLTAYRRASPAFDFQQPAADQQSDETQDQPAHEAAESTDAPESAAASEAAADEEAPTTEEAAAVDAAPDAAGREPSTATEVPELPWPPMAPTASHVIDSTMFGIDSDVTPSAIDAVLSRALRNTGYTFTYYLTPDDGYSIVTHMEKFDCHSSVGAIIDKDRWVVTDKPLTFRDVFSERFWKRIFTNEPTGCYRMFIFLVGERGFSPKGAETWDASRASLLSQEGWSAFPREELADVAYPDGFQCDALVYQYSRYVNSSEAERIERGGLGAISALRHLKHAAGDLLTADELSRAEKGDD